MANLRICCWNVRRASAKSAAWDLFHEISPDLALLQEVNGLPQSITDQYQVVKRPAAGRNRPQRFSTAILTRGIIGTPIQLTSQWNWVDRELERFAGNLLAYHVSINGREYRVLSAYSPAWPVEPERLCGIDIEPVKLKLNPKVWVTELLWAALHNAMNSDHQIPWVVGGDLNSSETFDLWKGGPRGNREFLDRMHDLGLRESLRQWNNELVPTFRNLRGGKFMHQMDHLFVSESMSARLVSCITAEPVRVFGASLSDHLPIIAEFSEHDSAVGHQQLSAFPSPDGDGSNRLS